MASTETFLLLAGCLTVLYFLTPEEQKTTLISYKQFRAKIQQEKLDRIQLRLNRELKNINLPMDDRTKSNLRVLDDEISGLLLDLLSVNKRYPGQFAKDDFDIDSLTNTLDEHAEKIKGIFVEDKQATLQFLRENTSKTLVQQQQNIDARRMQHNVKNEFNQQHNQENKILQLGPNDFAAAGLPGRSAQLGGVRMNQGRGLPSSRDSGALQIQQRQPGRSQTLPSNILALPPSQGAQVPNTFNSGGSSTIIPLPTALTNPSGRSGDRMDDTR